MDPEPERQSLETTPRPPGRRRRWPRRVLVALLLLAIGVLLRNPLLGPPLCRLAEARLAAALGGEWRVEGLSGSWYDGVKLARVRGRNASGTPIRDLDVRDLRLRWSLPALLRRRPDWPGSLGVRAQRLAVTVDLDLLPADGGASGPGALPAALPVLQLGQVEAVAAWQGHRLELISTDLKLGPEPVGRLGAASLQVTGPEAQGRVDLAGTLDLRHLPPKGLAGLEAEAGLEVQDLPALARRLGLVSPAAPPPLPDRLEIQASLASGRMEVHRLVAAGPTGRLRIRGRLQAAGGGAGADPSPWSCQADVDFAVSRPGALPGLDRIPLVEPLRGGLRITGTGTPSAWSIALEDAFLETAGEVLALAGPARLEQAGGILRVVDLGLDGPLGEFRVAGNLPLTLLAGGRPSSTLPLDLRLTIADLEAARASGLLPALWPLPFQGGRLNLDLRAGGTLGEPALDAELHVGDLLLAPVAGPPPPGRLDLDLAMDGDATGIRVERLALNAPGLELELDGRAELPLDLPALLAGRHGPSPPSELTLRLEGAVTDPGWSALFLPPSSRTGLPGGPVHCTAEAVLDEAGIRVAGLELKVPGLSASLAGRAELTGLPAYLVAGGPRPRTGVLAARLEARGDPTSLAAWLGATFVPPGRLALAVTAAGNVLEPDLRCEARYWSEEATEPALELRGLLPLDLSRGGLLATAPASLEVFLRDLDLTAPPLAEDQGLAAGRATGHLRLAGPLAAPGLTGKIKIRDLTAAPGLLPVDPGPMTVDLSLRRDDDGAAVLELQELRAQAVTARGVLHSTRALDLHAILRGAPPPWVGPLQGTLEVDCADLGLLAQLPAVRRSGGRLHAEARLDGSLDAPDVTGFLDLEDGVFRPASTAVAALEGLQGRLRLAGDRLVLEDLRGEYGAAPFQARGAVALDGGDGRPRLDLAVRGRDLLLWRREGVRLRADADLTLTGTPDALLARGTLRLTSGLWRRHLDLLALPEGGVPGGGEALRGLRLFELEPPLNGLRFDLDLQTAEPVRIVTNVARGRLLGDLHLGGTGAVPLLSGELYLEDVAVSLPASRMRLDRGVVRFLPEDPFVPRLDLVARMRRYGYDVQAVVTGPYDAPEILLSSTPPLPRDQLLLLVTAGQEPGDEPAPGRALGSVAVYLARDLAGTLLPAGGSDEEESFFDRFEGEVGRDASRSGEETVTGRFLLFRDVLVPGDALLLEGERDAWGDFNLGLRIRFRFQ